METTEIKPRKRIFYLDALRCLAILSVMTVHIFMPAMKFVVGDYSTVPSLNWFIDDFFVSFRIGVDLFLMLAGALSLGRDWEIKTFLAKRIPRILAPFLFWGTVLGLLMIFLSINFPEMYAYVFNTFKSYPAYFINIFFANSPTFGPYWFFWMILGTYLIMPIFNKWLYHSNLKEAEYFLVFWLITSLFDYTLMQNFPIKLSYFTSPIGLAVLGYYLRYTERKIFKNLYVPILFVVIGIIALIYGSYLKSDPTQIIYFNRYSIITVTVVSGIFLLFRNISDMNISVSFFTNPDGIFRKSIFSIAKYSYGIYLIHNVFITIIFQYFGVYMPQVGFKTLVCCMFFGSLFMSWTFMALLNRVPYLNKVIGAK